MYRGLKLNAKAAHIFQSIEDQQRHLARNIGGVVVFPKSGNRGILLSVAYGQAEVQMEKSGEVEWAHVVLVEVEE